MPEPVSRPALVIVSVLLLSPGLVAQQPPPQRDPQAIAVLQQAVVAMGGVVPTDAVATGAIVIVAGSTTENGTIQILARGLDQSAEHIDTLQGRRSIIYSRGRARDERSTRALQLELTVTSQSSSFPLQLIASALTDAESAFQYAGLESLHGQQVHHIRFWRTFLSNPKLQPLAELSKKEIWVDAASKLPRKLAYERRASRGPGSFGIPVAVFYSDYRNVGGIVCPYRIERSLNGTPWGSITIQNIAFNNGLRDDDFPIP